MVNKTKIPLGQQFYYYRGAAGNNEVFANRSSGAYIFRPNGTEPHIIGEIVKINTYKGIHFLFIYLFTVHNIHNRNIFEIYSFTFYTIYTHDQYIQKIRFKNTNANISH